MAGLPGTGLGGIFYVLLVLWIALREALIAAKGASTRDRWRRIVKLGSIAGSIVGALWAEGLALTYLAGQVQEHVTAWAQAIPQQARNVAVEALTPALGLVPLILLAILLLSLQLARMAVSTRESAGQ